MTAHHSQRPTYPAQRKDTPPLTYRQEHDHTSPDIPDAATVPPQPPVPVFAPARLRGYRHLRGLDHAALAHAAHTTTATLVAIESREASPSPALITVLARALGCSPVDLHTTGDPADNSGYWDVICAALPPLTDTEISTTATAFRRATDP